MVILHNGEHIKYVKIIHMEQTQAPIFTTTDSQGNEIHLKNYLGQRILIYFYPKDMTPGCTTEALGFQDLYTEFKK